MNIMTNITLFLVILYSFSSTSLWAMEKSTHAEIYQPCVTSQIRCEWLYRDVKKQINDFVAAGMQKNRIFEFFHNFAYLVEPQLVSAFESILCANLRDAQGIVLFTRQLRELIQFYSTTHPNGNTFNYKKIIYPAVPGGLGSGFLVYEDSGKQDTIISWLLAYYYASMYLKNYGLVHDSYYAQSNGGGYARSKFAEWLYASIGRGADALPLIRPKKKGKKTKVPHPTLFTIAGNDRLKFTQKDVEAISSSSANALLNDPETFCYADFETVVNFFSGDFSSEEIQKK